MASRHQRSLAYGAFGVAIALLIAISLSLYRTAALPGLAPDEDRPPVADSVPVIGAPPTVMVLPFQVLGDDPDQLYLARGLTAELTTDLSRFSGLRVVGAGTAPETQGETSPPGNAHFQIWGGVQRTDEHLRVEVLLVEAISGRKLWAERYDRPFGDLFAVQDEIGTRLAKALSVEVTEAERSRLAHRFSHSVEAYDLFLRARAALLVRGRRENEQARDLLRQAIELDPAFARAYGGLALTSAADYRNRWVEGGQASIALLRRAMQVDPAAGYLYFLLLGRAYFFLDDSEQALINLREAISRNPANLEVHVYLAAVLVFSGDGDGAQWEAEEIRIIEPDFSIRDWLETYPMTDARQKERLVSILAGLGL